MLITLECGACPVPANFSDNLLWLIAALEQHPENQPPYDVLLGRAGDIRLQQQGRDWQTFPKADPNRQNVPGGCVYFAETQHSVCGVFLSAYRGYGLNFPGVSGISPQESLALFGQPLSELMTEVLEDGQPHTVQWFERARFEEHPANTPPYNVLFGRLGAEILNTSLSSTANKPPVVETVWHWEGTTLSDGSRMPANDPSRYTLQFRSDSTVTVKADCNQVAGTYTLKSSSLTITLGPSTMAACPPDSQATFAVRLPSHCSKAGRTRHSPVVASADRNLDHTALISVDHRRMVWSAYAAVVRWEREHWAEWRMCSSR